MRTPYATSNPMIACSRPIFIEFAGCRQAFDSWASIFMISRIISSFCLASDSATSSVSAAEFRAAGGLLDQGDGLLEFCGVAVEARFV